MSDPFYGEIRMVGFNFPPHGWAQCDGQIMNISQNAALFSLLGTFYGGNGTTNFALPNLQGQVPVHQGQGNGLSNRVIGVGDGQETHTLLGSEMPQHTHSVLCDTLGGKKSTPVGNFPSPDGLAVSRPFATATDGASFSPNVLGSVGGGQPHSNMMPFLVVNFIIALSGIFPARS